MWSMLPYKRCYFGSAGNYQIAAWLMQINKLLGMYEQQTGSSFGGSDAEYSILSKLVNHLAASDNCHCAASDNCHCCYFSLPRSMHDAACLSLLWLAGFQQHWHSLLK